jgi:superfamily II DNA/RNA helicase
MDTGRLASALKRDGFNTAAIHGDKSQEARIEALDDFKSGKVNVLVATDVAARGIDIAELPAVINFELPYVAEDYVHRIGRTGRAGASGIAISLVSPEDERLLVDIEKLLKKSVRREPLPDLTGRRRDADEGMGRVVPPPNQPRDYSATRRVKDESAFDLNPDQPMPKRPAGRFAVRKKEVAALLMPKKVPTAQP